MKELIKIEVTVQLDYPKGSEEYRQHGIDTALDNALGIKTYGMCTVIPTKAKLIKKPKKKA